AIDQRSDVYSLGAILYEMLILQPPVEKSGGYLDILMRVMQGDILPPEQRVTQISDASAKRRAIPKELSAVAMKALAKAPRDRSPNGESLRQDIERFQEGRSVSAKEDTFREMAWKLVKRNKGASTGAAAAFIIIVVSLWFVVRSGIEAKTSYAQYRHEQET